MMPRVLGMMGRHRALEKILGVGVKSDAGHILGCVSASGISKHCEKNTQEGLFTFKTDIYFVSFI